MTLPIDGMPGWVVRELSVLEWNELEAIRLSDGDPDSVRESRWLARLMVLSVESEKGDPRWGDVAEVKVSELAKHGEAIANAALEVNGFGSDAGNG